MAKHTTDWPLDPSNWRTKSYHDKGKKKTQTRGRKRMQGVVCHANNVLRPAVGDELPVKKCKCGDKQPILQSSIHLVVTEFVVGYGEQYTNLIFKYRYLNKFLAMAMKIEKNFSKSKIHWKLFEQFESFLSQC